MRHLALDSTTLYNCHLAVDFKTTFDIVVFYLESARRVPSATVASLGFGTTKCSPQPFADAEPPGFDAVGNW